MSSIRQPWRTFSHTSIKKDWIRHQRNPYLVPGSEIIYFCAKRHLRGISINFPAENVVLQLASGWTGAKDALRVQANLGLGNDSRIVNAAQHSEFTSGSYWMRFLDGTIIQKGVLFSVHRAFQRQYLYLSLLHNQILLLQRPTALLLIQRMTVQRLQQLRSGQRNFI